MEKGKKGKKATLIIEPENLEFLDLMKEKGVNKTFIINQSIKEYRKARKDYL